MMNRVAQGFNSSIGERPSSRSKAKRLQVSFSSVTITQYTIKPCVNPACMQGPAITMDKAISTRGPLNLDLYEFSRVPVRRRNDDLRMTGYQREELLMTLYGFSRDDINHAISEEEQQLEQSESKKSKMKVHLRQFLNIKSGTKSNMSYIMMKGDRSTCSASEGTLDDSSEISLSPATRRSSLTLRS